MSMSYQEQTATVPLVFEQSVVSQPLPLDGDNTVIAGVPSIHARIVDVILRCDTAINSVWIKIYGAGGAINATIQISGVIALNTSTALRYGDTPAMNQALGDFYDIIVNYALPGAGPPGKVSLWTAARS